MIRFTLLHFGIGQEMRQQKSRNSHHDKKYTNSHNPSILIIQPFAYRIENCMPLLNRELTIKIINNLHDHLKKQACGKMWKKCGENPYNLFPKCQLPVPQQIFHRLSNRGYVPGSYSLLKLISNLRQSKITHTSFTCMMNLPMPIPITSLLNLHANISVSLPKRDSGHHAFIHILHGKNISIAGIS